MSGALTMEACADCGTPFRSVELAYSTVGAMERVCVTCNGARVRAVNDSERAAHFARLGLSALDTFDGYQREMMQPWRLGDGDRDPGYAFDKCLSLCGLGLTGEAGEVADLIKKVVHHGREFTPEVQAKMIEEMGDVLWYMARLCEAMGVTLSSVATSNVAKLNKRYPRGFNLADSVERKDEK